MGLLYTIFPESARKTVRQKTMKKKLSERKSKLMKRAVFISRFPRSDSPGIHPAILKIPAASRMIRSATTASRPAVTQMIPSS